MTSNYTALAKPIRNTFNALITIPANNPMGTAVNLTIYTDPEQPSITSTFLQAFSNEEWYIYKVKSMSSPAIDGIIKFRVDTIAQNISFGPLSATLPSLEHTEDFINDFMVLQPMATGQPYFVPYAANGSVAINQYVQIYVLRVPLSYKGKISF